MIQKFSIKKIKKSHYNQLGDYAESFVFCPHCERSSYLYLGNMDDLSIEDIEGMICYYCNGKSFFPELDVLDLKYLNYEKSSPESYFK